MGRTQTNPQDTHMYPVDVGRGVGLVCIIGVVAWGRVVVDGGCGGVIVARVLELLQLRHVWLACDRGLQEEKRERLKKNLMKPVHG